MSTLDFVTQQLKLEKAAFHYAYGNAAKDEWITNALAQVIVNAGVRDIRDIALYDADVWIDQSFGTNVDGSPIMGKVLQHTRFFYNALTGNELLQFGNLDPLATDNFFWSVADTEVKADISIHFLRDTTPYFLVKLWPISHGGVLGDFFETIQPFIPVLLIAANFIWPGFGQALGQSILGPLGVTNATAAGIVGNTALSTIANGGNVEAAVTSSLKGALTGGLGNAVGDFAGLAVNSDVVGKVAAAATSAALSGGDINSAVVSTLLPLGVKTVQSNLGSSNLDFFGEDDTPTGGIENFTAFDVETPSIEFDSSIFGDPTAQVGASMDDTGISPVDIPVYTDTPAVVTADTPSGSSSPSDWLGALSNIAVAAIKINNAYQSAGKPAFQVSGKTANGGTVVANKNGTVTVNGHTGVMPRGTPYVTQDGTIVVNNGDGTYTSIGSSGVPVTSRYPINPTTGNVLAGMSSQTMLFVGGGILALVFLASQRRGR